MKRIILLFAIALCGSVWAQTYDTVSGKDGILPHFYYPDGWYDTCDSFFDTRYTPENLPNMPEEWGSFMISHDGGLSTYPGAPDNPAYCTVYEHYIDGPVAFTGVAVMMFIYGTMGRKCSIGTTYRDTSITT